MNCRNIKTKFPDYLIGDIDQKTQTIIQSHLADCVSCRSELEGLSAIWTKLGVLPEELPSEGLRTRFYTMLEAYKQGIEQEESEPRLHKTVSRWLAIWWPRQPAVQFSMALLLLVIGLFAGYALKPNPIATADIQPLQKEVEAMRSTLALSLLDHNSASERLRGVSLSSNLDQPDAKLLESLFTTLDRDPNINVRLAVVDVLYLFRNHPAVRQGISNTLGNQTSPLVQVALIDLIVSIRESKAIDALKGLIQNDQLAPEVRQRAQQGLELL